MTGMDCMAAVNSSRNGMVGRQACLAIPCRFPSPAPPTHRYVLLRGRKRFRLYAPQLASKMYTVGKVAKVHPNGRIVFKGQVRLQVVHMAWPVVLLPH